MNNRGFEKIDYELKHKYNYHHLSILWENNKEIAQNWEEKKKKESILYVKIVIQYQVAKDMFEKYTKIFF